MFCKYLWQLRPIFRRSLQELLSTWLTKCPHKCPVCCSFAEWCRQREALIFLKSYSLHNALNRGCLLTCKPSHLLSLVLWSHIVWSFSNLPLCLEYRGENWRMLRFLLVCSYATTRSSLDMAVRSVSLLCLVLSLFRFNLLWCDVLTIVS